MKRNKAYKYRIYPNQEQQTFFTKTFGCVRFIYNKMLEEKINYYETEKKMLKNTPAMYKNRYPFLKEVDSLALSNAQRNLESAYRKFFREPCVGFPKYKSKHRSRASYTTNNQKGTIAIEEGLLKLPKIKSGICIKIHRAISEDMVIKSATVSRTPTGKYYVSLLVEYEVKTDEKELQPMKVAGLDFSLKGLYVRNDGKREEYPEYYLQQQKKLTREQRKLSRCEKGSKNREKQRRKVSGIHEKISNQRKDFLHKLSRQIANVYGVVAVEDLNLKEMSKMYGKGVHDRGYGIFVKMLEYKMEEAGKEMVRIDRWYPSSKTCSRCGVVKPSLSIHTRIYECACGYKEDRDVNAAINIRREGIIRLISA